MASIRIIATNMSFSAKTGAYSCLFGMLIISIFGLSGCQSTNSQAQPTHTLNGSHAANTPGQRALDDRERAELYHAILAAELAAGNQENAAALTHYLFALSIAPDTKIAAEAITLAHRENDPDALIQASEAWLEVSPNTAKAIEANILGHLIQANESEALRYESLESAYQMTSRFINNSSDHEQLFRELSGINRLYLHNVTLALWQQLVRNQVHPPLSWSLLAHAQYLAGNLVNNDVLKQRAENSVNAALRKDSNFAPAINLKVQILRATDREQLAIDFLHSLILDNRENSGAYVELAQHYYRTGEFDRGVKLVKDWLSFAPESLEARYFLAASYYGQRNFTKALEEFRALVTANYKPDTTYYYCGDTAERIEQYHQAIACYRQVTSGKYWYQAKRQLSFLLAYQHEEGAALADLETIALNSTPQKAEEAIVIKADLLVYLEQKTQAIEWLKRFTTKQLQSLIVTQKYLELHYSEQPDSDWQTIIWKVANKLRESLRINWYLQSSSFFSSRNRPQLAVDILNIALATHHDDIDLLYSRALLREPLNQPQLLEEELRYVHKLQPNNPHIMNALGYTLADQNKQLDLALELVEKAHKVLPRSAAVLDSLGWIFYRKGDLVQAEQWLRLSTDKEKTPETGAHLIEILIKQNKVEQAKKLIQQYIKQFDDHPKLLELLESFKTILEPSDV